MCRQTPNVPQAQLVLWMQVPHMLFRIIRQRQRQRQPWVLRCSSLLWLMLLTRWMLGAFRSRKLAAKTLVQFILCCSQVKAAKPPIQL